MIFQEGLSLKRVEECCLIILSTTSCIKRSLVSFRKYWVPPFLQESWCYIWHIMSWPKSLSLKKCRKLLILKWLVGSVGLPIFWPIPDFPPLPGPPAGRPLFLFVAAWGRSTFTTRRRFFGSLALAWKWKFLTHFNLIWRRPARNHTFNRFRVTSRFNLTGCCFDH